MTHETLLLRQVHPNWTREGRITSQVFSPTPKDKKRLSVYDGDKMTPEEAYDHYTQQSGFSSLGIMGVTAAECQKEALPVVPEPAVFPEHVVIDFSTYTNAEIKKEGETFDAGGKAPGLVTEEGGKLMNDAGFAFPKKDLNGPLAPRQLTHCDSFGNRQYIEGILSNF